MWREVRGISTGVVLNLNLVPQVFIHAHESDVIVTLDDRSNFFFKWKNRLLAVDLESPSPESLSLNGMATLYRPEEIREAVCAKSSPQGCLVDSPLTGPSSISQNQVS